MKKLLVFVYFSFIFSIQTAFADVTSDIFEYTLGNDCGEGGFININIIEGNPDSYSFFWTALNGQTINNPYSLFITELQPGNYAFTIYDFYGCENYYVFTIEEDFTCTFSFEENMINDCLVQISINVESNGVVYSSSQLNILWDDDDPSNPIYTGLTRQISLENIGEDWSHCVDVSVIGNESCCSTEECFNYAECEPQIVNSFKTGCEVVINEIGSSKLYGQFIELLIACGDDCAEKFDLRYHYIDDNDGNMIKGNEFVNEYNKGKIGISSGRVQFNNNEIWKDISSGTLIVIAANTELLNKVKPNEKLIVVNINDKNYFKCNSFNKSKSKINYKSSNDQMITINGEADGIQILDENGAALTQMKLGKSVFTQPFVTNYSRINFDKFNISLDEFDYGNKSYSYTQNLKMSLGKSNSVNNQISIDKIKNCKYIEEEEIVLKGDEPLITDNQYSVKCYPNPFTDFLFLESNVSKNTTFKVNLFSITGRLLKQFDWPCITGKNELTLKDNVLSFSSVILFLEFTNEDGFREYLKVVKITK